MMAFSKKKCCQYHSPFQIKKWKFSRWIPNTHKMKLKRFLESKWWEGITISHRFHHSNQVRPLLHSLRSRRISPCATWKASSLCPTSLARDHSTAGMTFSGKRMNNTDYFLQGGLPPTWCTWLLRLVKKNIYEKNGGFFSRLEQEPCWHFEQGTGRHAAASRPSMLVILVTPRVCGTSFQDPQAQKKN